jgi:transcriptional regulator with PAS, ATPase and Fis domain
MSDERNRPSCQFGRNEDPFPEIDGTSAAIRRLKQDMQKVARDRDVTVLLLGESGTGKERVARAIHRASRRSRAPFVVIDCAGLSATLVEDQLFGHVRGAFTGAVADRPGPFERAAGGTVLLDEVGDLAPDLQMKLLRVLQARTTQRLGGGQERAFDVRVIASTHVDLIEAVAGGRFRQDLFYRLRVYDITIPALRSRSATDIRMLIQTILARLSERRRRGARTLDPEALDHLVRYTWPGNVRELENTLERMIVAAGAESVLTRRHLPDGFGALSRAASRLSLALSPSPAETVLAMERHNFNLVATAANLGLSRYQLYRLLKRHGMRDVVRR